MSEKYKFMFVVDNKFFNTLEEVAKHLNTPIENLVFDNESKTFILFTLFDNLFNIVRRVVICKILL